MFSGVISPDRASASGARGTVPRVSHPSGAAPDVRGGTDPHPFVSPRAGDPRRRLTQDEIVALYEAHHDALVRFARVVAPEDGSAEDLVQEAFVRLYASWGRIRDHDKVPAYLRSTIVNLARGRGRRIGVAFRHRPEPSRDAASAEDGALAGENRREVLRVLRSLPPRQRECLVLRYYEGMRETEIAHTLGLSVGSVRTHTSRGMAALQRQLATTS